MPLLQETYSNETTPDLIDKILDIILESEYFLDCIFRHFGKRFGEAFLSMVNYGTLSASEYKVVSAQEAEKLKLFFENIDFGKIALDTGVEISTEQQSLIAVEFQTEVISHITRYQIFDDFKNDDFGEKYTQINKGRGFKIFQSLSDGKVYLKLGNHFIPEEILTEAGNGNQDKVYFPGINCIYIYSNETGKIIELVGELEEVYDTPGNTILQVVTPHGDAPQKRKLYHVQHDITYSLNIGNTYGEIHDVIENSGNIYCVQSSFDTHTGFSAGKERQKAEKTVRIIEILSGNIVSEIPGYFSKSTNYGDITLIHTLERTKNKGDKENDLTLHISKISKKGCEQLSAMRQYDIFETDKDEIYITTIEENKLILSFVTMLIEPYGSITKVHILDEGVMIEFSRNGEQCFFRSQEFMTIS